MEVDYKSLFYEGEGHKRSYRIEETRYCCDRLKMVIEDKNFLSSLDIIRQTFDTGNDDEVKIALFLMEYAIDDQFVASGYELNEAKHKMDFCPFCGSKIVFNEVKKVKVIEHVKKVPKTICDEIHTEEEIEIE